MTTTWYTLFTPHGAGSTVAQMKVIDSWNCDCTQSYAEAYASQKEQIERYIREHGEGIIQVVKGTRRRWL